MHCFGDEDVKLNYEYLDTQDFSGYFKEGRHSLSDAMSQIDEDYDESPELPEFLQGCVFNYLSRQEVADYLCNRYGMSCIEVISYDYYKELEAF